MGGPLPEWLPAATAAATLVAACIAFVAALVVALVNARAARQLALDALIANTELHWLAEYYEVVVPCVEHWNCAKKPFSMPMSQHFGDCMHASAPIGSMNSQ